MRIVLHVEDILPGKGVCHEATCVPFVFHPSRLPSGLPSASGPCGRGRRAHWRHAVSIAERSGCARAARRHHHPAVRQHSQRRNHLPRAVNPGRQCIPADPVQQRLPAYHGRFLCTKICKSRAAATRDPAPPYPSRARTSHVPSPQAPCTAWIAGAGPLAPR